MKSFKSLIFLIVLVFILFLGFKKKENFEDDIFYTSKLRLTDYQDIISSTESQLVKTT
jgi:hypothetical protein